MKSIGRKAIETKLSKRISITHEVAAQIRATEDNNQKLKNNETKRCMFTRDHSGTEMCQLSADDNSDEAGNVNLFSLIIILCFVISLFKYECAATPSMQLLFILL